MRLDRNIEAAHRLQRKISRSCASGEFHRHEGLILSFYHLKSIIVRIEMRKAQALASTHPTANRRSIAELEQELLRLKQKEKKYSSMANKLRELEEKSKVIRRGNNALAS